MSADLHHFVDPLTAGTIMICHPKMMRIQCTILDLNVKVNFKTGKNCSQSARPILLHINTVKSGAVSYFPLKCLHIGSWWGENIVDKISFLSVTTVLKRSYYNPTCSSLLNDTSCSAMVSWWGRFPGGDLAPSGPSGLQLSNLCGIVVWKMASIHEQVFVHTGSLNFIPLLMTTFSRQFVPDRASCSLSVEKTIQHCSFNWLAETDCH